MFPLTADSPYINENGSRSKLGSVIGSGGQGSPFTPDYTNEVLVIGQKDNYEYYIPMSKRYVGPGVIGYEVETKSTSSQSAIVDVNQIIVDAGSVVSKTLLKSVAHTDSSGYSDDNISLSYGGSTWTLTLKKPYSDLTGTAYTSPLTWGFSSEVDYKMIPVINGG